MKKLIFILFFMVILPCVSVAGVWTLEVRYGITGWGAGGFVHMEYPSEESCYKALDKMVVKADNQQAGEDDEQVIAICRPGKK